MPRTIRRRPSPAMVVAMLALFVALGSTSVAAIKLQKNAVKTKNLSKGVVKTSKIAGGAVTTSKIDDGAVTTPKINSGALTASKLGTLTRRNESDLGVADGASGSATAHCLPGERAISGGHSTSGGASGDGWAVSTSVPDAAATEWRVDALNNTGAANNLGAYVLCLESG